jgi:hypothetical protein
MGVQESDVYSFRSKLILSSMNPFNSVLMKIFGIYKEQPRFQKHVWSQNKGEIIETSEKKKNTSMYLFHILKNRWKYFL